MNPPLEIVRLGKREIGAASGRALAPAALLLVLAACYSTSPAYSGAPPRHDGPSDDRLRRPRQRAQGHEGDAIARVFLEPSVLKIGSSAASGWADVAPVRREVDRQICLRIRERFQIVSEPEPDAGIVRTTIVRIDLTSPSDTTATNFIFPMSLAPGDARKRVGGLAVEAQLLAPDGQLVATIRWSRTTQGLAALKLPTSPIGDALRLARPMGTAIGRAFAAAAPKARPNQNPDPCARLGLRQGGARSSEAKVSPGRSE